MGIARRLNIQTFPVHLKGAALLFLCHTWKTEIFVNVWHLPPGIQTLDNPPKSPYPFSSVSILGCLCFLRIHCFCQPSFICFCLSPTFLPSHIVSAHCFFGHPILPILSYFLDLEKEMAAFYLTDHVMLWARCFIDKVTSELHFNQNTVQSLKGFILIRMPRNWLYWNCPRQTGNYDHLM